MRDTSGLRLFLTDYIIHTQEEDIHPHEKKGAAPVPEEHFQVAPQKGDTNQ